MELLQQLLDLTFDPRMIRLQEHDRAFNPFRILGLERYEIRHVKTLAWLLDPSESHGLGDSFFKLFMHVVCDANGGVEVLAEIAKSGDCALHVRREITTKQLETLATSETDDALHGNPQEMQEPEALKARAGFLDLLVRGSGWLVGVEAKIGSRQHSHQLQRYRNAIEKGAWTDRRQLVYLTCDESDEPDDPEWVHITWGEAVVEPLRAILEAPAMKRSERPEIAFLRGYLEVLEEQCNMPDSDRDVLLRGLLDTHAGLMRRIVGNQAKNLPGDVSRIVELNSKLIGELSRRCESASEKRYPALVEMVRSLENPRLALSESVPSTIRFLPQSWQTEFPWIQQPHRPFPGVVCELFNRAGSGTDLGVQFKLMICDLGSDFARDAHYAQRRQLLDLIQRDEKLRKLFPRAFLRNGAPRKPNDRYFGIMLTRWFNANADDPQAVRRFMEAEFLPSVQALTVLMREVRG